jgi:creatinine amidohydrolase/Fe(II)-dependent formamide hydrolase-like protein/dienelactone hydrolase
VLAFLCLVTATVPAAGQVRRVSELNTRQLQALDRAKTVVFLPGGMLEEHGPYLPAYTDGFLSERLTDEVAARLVAARAGWTALVFPQIPLGSSGSNEIGGQFVFPGTFSLRPATLRSVFLDLADEVGSQGFRVVVIVHVHGAPLHNRALDEASDYFRDTYGGRMVHLWGLVPVLQGWGTVLQGLTDAEKKEEGVSLHAGMDETSLMLHLRPDLVSADHKQAPVVTGQTLQESFDVARGRDWPGYLGSPRLASPDLGRRIWESFSAAATTQLDRMLDSASAEPPRRYGDLLAANASYRGWILTATAEQERRLARQREWLYRRTQASAFTLPTPTGQHAVGTSAFAVETPTPTGDPGRTLVVTTWYPARDTTGLRRAPYLREEVALQAVAAAGSSAVATPLAQRGVVTHGWLDAPVAALAGRLPVLVFSHGYLAMPSDYTALMEDLASHGYAVFSIAHTGETMGVTLPGGRLESIFGPGNRLASVPLGVISEWNAEDSVATAVTTAADHGAADATLRAYLARIPLSTAAVDRWVADTRAVVDEIVRLASSTSGSRYAGRLDLSRLGAIGHSMGGVASAAYCARDTRCRGAVNLDGSPQYGDLIDRPSRHPMLMVYASRPGRVGVNDPIYGKGTAYWSAVLAGALHLNFGDWQYWEGPTRLNQSLGPITSARCAEVLGNLVREFFAAHLDGRASPLLSGATTVPELSVRRKSR